MENKEFFTLVSEFNKIPVYTQKIKVKDVITISYIAVRGKDNEDGSVQRVLNRRRIKDIRDYILTGKEFFSTFILNWTDKNFKLEHTESKIKIPITPSSAQVLDGQHRLAGLIEAIKVDDAIGEREILVSLCEGLTTKQAAEIFLNINSEQKPVSKSLIYDLFGVIDDNKDFHINRARDIATALNENPDSPYYGMIKTPGLKRGEGFVDLSAVINVLKNFIKKGDFEKHKLSGLDFQINIFINYFKAIKFFYDKQNESLWTNKNKNPFARNAGITSAIEFFINSLVEKCKERKSFTVDTFKELLNLEPVLSSEELKNLNGFEAQSRITDFLEANILLLSPEQDEYDV